MKNRSYRYYIAIFIFIFLLITIIGIISYSTVSITSNNSIILKTFNVKKSNTLKKNKFVTPFYKKYSENFKSGKNVISTNFNYEKGIVDPHLVLSLVYANGYKIFINGDFVGSLGDIDKKRSSIWTYTKLFNINTFIKKDKKNRIKIVTNSDFQFGFGKSPFITNRKRAVRYYIINNLYNIILPIVSIGSLLFISLIFILLNIFTLRRNYKKIIFMILSFLFIALYFLDYLFIEYIPFSYLVFRKIIFVSLYLSNIFLLIGIFNYLKIKISIISRVFISLYLFFIIKILFFTPAMINLVNTYKIGNILVVLFLIFLVIRTLMKYIKSKSIKALIIFLSALLASPFFIHDIYILVFSKEGTILSHFGLMFIYILLGIIILYDFTKLYRRMKREKEKANLYYKDSLRDSLTESFNRKILKKLSNKNISLYTVIMADMDNFKYINDNYGHLIGDKVLKKVSYIINNRIRESDYLIRYGGDEFMIFLLECHVNDAFKIAKNILNDINNINKIEQKEISSPKISISMGIAESTNKSKISNIIKKADQYLYKAKNSQYSIISDINSF